MIEKITVHKYKKLVNIDFTFSNRMNVISGTNGTCKTSLLHLMSNSFKSPTLSSENYSIPNCIGVIKKNNIIVNPKIEALVRDAKNYADPSNGLKGELFEITYTSNKSLKFRKHNSKIANRYAIKPYYSKSDAKQYLPTCLIIYLGLSRLFPTGEIRDELLDNKKCDLPEEYLSTIISLYKRLTNIDVIELGTKNVGGFKSGPNFSSSKEGIDDNTISSGEDNVLIILKALVSLSYYYDSITNKDNNINSMLLIDEFDATLHPSLQIKLFDIIKEYSEKYKIQVAITTHSLSLLEYAIESKDKVIYLLNNHTDVSQIDNPTMTEIKMFLKNETKASIYRKKRIPIFTEDDEARVFLNELFDYYEIKNSNFALIRSFFHLVQCKIGADNLSTIFNDPYLLDTSLKSICILDGDHKGDLAKCTLKLPGEYSPEKMFFDYSSDLYENHPDFWGDSDIISLGYTKDMYLYNIKPDIEKIDQKIEEKKSNKEKTKGLTRQLNKEVFQKHIEFFRLVILHWLRNPSNKSDIVTFYKNLNTVFLKVCIPNGIEKEEWDFTLEGGQ